VKCPLGLFKILITMLRKFLLSLGLLFLIGNSMIAQRTWSLERCIKHVEASNSPTIRLAEIDVDRAKVLQRRAQARRQPTLNFLFDLGANFGRVDDPVTGIYENQSIIYNTLFLQGNYSLYDGGRTKKEIERSDLDFQVAELEAEQLTQDMTLDVLQTYLSILLAEEHLDNARKNLQQTNDWLAQMQKKVRGGIYSQSDLQTVEIQKARDQQAIIDRQNFVDKNYVALKILLEMDPSQPLEIEKPNNITFTEGDLQKLPFSRVYNRAVQSQPAFKVGELKVKNAQLEGEIARGSKKPTVDLYAGVWSSYSSATRSNEVESTQIFRDSFKNAFAENSIAGEDLFYDVEVPFYFKALYPEQIFDNLGYGVGVRVNVPILDQKASQLDSELAHLNMKQAQEEDNERKQRLKADIQNAILDVEAADKKLKATEKTYRLADEAVEFMRKKLSSGNVGAFEVKVALSERDEVETELVIAKYDYLLKKMVIDYYEGRPLEF